MRGGKEPALGGGKRSHPEWITEDVISQKGVFSGTIHSRKASSVRGRNQRAEDCEAIWDSAQNRAQDAGYAAPPGDQWKQAVKRSELEALLGIIDQILEADKKQICNPVPLVLDVRE